MPESPKKAVRYILYGLVFYVAVKYGLPLIAPFAIGLGVAAAVQKPAALLSERIPALSRRTSCVIMTSAVIFGAAVVIYFGVCSLVNGAVSFCPGIPERLAEMKRLVAKASSGTEGEGTWDKFIAFAASGANWCMDFFSENYREYLPSVLRRSTWLVSGIPSFAAGTLFAALSAFFSCGDFDGIRSGIKRLLPPETSRKASLLVRTSAETMAALLKTYGIIMLVTFAELAAGLGIINLAGYDTGSIVTVALIISVIDILPVLGTGTVLIPWGLYELISGRTVSGIMLLALFGIIETVRSLLEPKLISGRLKMHPFFTLAGMYAGGRLFGVWGIFIMPPAMMIFRQLHDSQ